MCLRGLEGDYWLRKSRSGENFKCLTCGFVSFLRSQCPGRAVRSVQNRPPVEAEVRSVFARGGVGMQEVKGTGRVWGSLFSNEPK